MKRLATAAFLALLVSIPLWVSNLYVLHVLITTGIFTIAAMSLNLLLGYTGQLSLGHVAFFGIGAYVSSLMSLGFAVHVTPDWLVTLDPQPVWLAMLWAIAISGFCGWAIGRISLKVRGAYFVIVTISFAEVVRLVALNWDELTQGPMALNNIRHNPIVSACWVFLVGKVPNYYLVLQRRSCLCRRAQLSIREPGAMIALQENRPLTSVRIEVTRYLTCCRPVSAAIAEWRARSTRSHPDYRSEHIPVHYAVTMVIWWWGRNAGSIVGA